jgi:myosin heavy subunit
LVKLLQIVQIVFREIATLQLLRDLKQNRPINPRPICEKFAKLAHRENCYFGRSLISAVCILSKDDENRSHASENAGLLLQLQAQRESAQKLEAWNKALEAECENARKDKERVLREVQDKLAMFDRLSSENAAMTGGMCFAFSEVQSKSEELQSKSEELQSKSEDLQSKSAELQSKSEELQQAQEELGKVRCQAEKLASLHEQQQRESEELTEKLARLEGECAGMSARLAGYEARQSELLESIASKDSLLYYQNYELNQRHHELQEKQAQLEQSEIGHRIELRELQARLVEREGRLERCSSEARQGLARITAEKERLQRDLLADREAASQELAKKAKKLSEAKLDCLTLRNRLARIELVDSDVETLQSEAKKSKAENEELKAELDRWAQSIFASNFAGEFANQCQKNNFFELCRTNGQLQSLQKSLDHEMQRSQTLAQVPI